MMVRRSHLGRRATLLIGSVAATCSALVPVAAGATPMDGAIVNDTCPQADMVCEATVSFSPYTGGQLGAAIDCSETISPTVGVEDQTGVACSLRGENDNVYYFSGSDTSSGDEPAAVTHTSTGLPKQPYQLCVQGFYQDANFAYIYSNVICTTVTTV